MKVEFYNPDFPEGMIFEIAGILMVNGEVTEVDAEMEERFEAHNPGVKLKDALDNVRFVKISGKKSQATLDAEKAEAQSAEAEAESVEVTTESPEKEGDN